MRIIGVDPGYERLGVAVVEVGEKGKTELIYSTCLTTPKTLSFPERLALLGAEFEKLLTQYSPDLLAIEELFFSGNQKTAMKVSEARGVMVYLAMRAGVRVINLTPLQVKMSITGYGRADKSQVTMMLGKLISIPKKIKHDDEYDAIAIALTGLAHEKQALIHNQGGH